MLGSDTLVVLLWDRHHAPVTRVDTNHCQESRRQYTNTVQLSFRQVFLVAGEMVWIQNLNPGGPHKNWVDDLCISTSDFTHPQFTVAF